MAGRIQKATDLYSVKVSAQVSRGGLGATSPYGAVDLLRSVCADHKIYTDSPTNGIGMTREQLAEIRTDVERAHTEVGDIAHDGYRRWRMSIPAQPSRDSDLIISCALTHAETLLAEVERLREELGQLRLDDEVEQRATAGAYDEKDPY